MQTWSAVGAVIGKSKRSASEEADMHCGRENDWPFQSIPRACGGSRERQSRDIYAAEAALCYR